MLVLDMSQFIVSETLPIIEAMNLIDRNSSGIVFVCRNDIVLATLTDGDIRRHILAGKSLTAPVMEAACYNFHALPANSDKDQVNELCDTLSLSVIPGIDRNGKLATIFFRDKHIVSFPPKIGVPVVIMAGGKGTRLYPYTKVLPKPLIPVGDLPITEHIINKFIQFGCNTFTMIINHKKEMIKAYFHENKLSDASVDFLEEEQFSGTGGGLSLLRSKVKGSFFFTNCDILILEDYSTIYEHHRASGNLLTMVCATKTFSFPYGTVDVGEEGNIRSLLEKPSYSFLTNTGFYVIEPQFLDYVPDNTFIHITDVIQNCIDKGQKIGIYPVSENQWLDMGNHEGMEKMLTSFLKEEKT
jgi:dTDP-glucose pyrophosphorylase